LQNGAVIQFVSSTGLETWGAKVNNSGTLNVLSGSRIATQFLQTSGTLQLGTGAVIGSVEASMGEGLLANTGQVVVIGGDVQNPVAFGLVHPEQTGKRAVENGLPDGTAKARFTIGDGHTPTAFRVLGGQTDFINHLGATLQIMPGATLELITNDNGSSHAFNNRRAFLTNSGDLLLAGQLQVQGNHAGITGHRQQGATDHPRDAGGHRAPAKQHWSGGLL